MQPRTPRGTDRHGAYVAKLDRRAAGLDGLRMRDHTAAMQPQVDPTPVLPGHHSGRAIVSDHRPHRRKIGKLTIAAAVRDPPALQLDHEHLNREGDGVLLPARSSQSWRTRRARGLKPAADRDQVRRLFARHPGSRRLRRRLATPNRVLNELRIGIAAARRNRQREDKDVGLALDQRERFESSPRRERVLHARHLTQAARRAGTTACRCGVRAVPRNGAQPGHCVCRDNLRARRGG